MITDRRRQPSVCKSPVQRKLLWNTVIWKNEHNRLWLHGCMAAWLCGYMTVWLYGCVAAWLSGYQYLEGAVWKLKPFTTAASSFYILVCCNSLVAGYCILWKMFKTHASQLKCKVLIQVKHAGIPVKASTGALRQCVRSTAWDLTMTVFGNDWIKAGNTLTIETSELVWKGASLHKATVTDSY